MTTTTKAKKAPTIADFFKSIGYTPIDKKKEATLRGKMANWQMVHPMLVDIQMSQKGLMTLASMMQAENGRDEGPRSHIMRRLYMKYSTLRRQMELEMLNDALYHGWEYVNESGDESAEEAEEAAEEV